MLIIPWFAFVSARHASVKIVSAYKLILRRGTVPVSQLVE